MHPTIRRREDLICTKKGIELHNSFGWNARRFFRDTLRAKYCGCTWKWNIFHSMSVCHFPHPVQDRKLIKVQVQLIMTLLRKRCRPCKIRTTMEWVSYCDLDRRPCKSRREQYTFASDEAHLAPVLKRKFSSSWLGSSGGQGRGKWLSWNSLTTTVIVTPEGSSMHSSQVWDQRSFPRRRVWLRVNWLPLSKTLEMRPYVLCYRIQKVSRFQSLVFPQRMGRMRH